MTMRSHCRWVLTGASGWFGKTALWEYERMYGPDSLRNNVIACSSTSKPIDFGSPYGPVAAATLESIKSINNASGLIHLAFITRDRIAQYGVDSYISQNRAITSLVAEFIDRHPGIPVVTTSSGAASLFDSHKSSLTADPYAALKLEEEQLWQQSSSQRFAAVFRVYAATGRFIKDPSVFALSDFLTRAMAGQRIEIRNKRPVFRSYGHVGTMMRIFWKILDSPPAHSFLMVDAVLKKLSLLDLAKTISLMWDLPQPLYDIDYSLLPDDYTADSSPFVDLLNSFRIDIPDFALQLKETADYIAATS